MNIQKTAERFGKRALKDGHTTKVIIFGATDDETIRRSFEGAIPESVIDGMQSNQMRARAMVSPIFAAVMTNDKTGEVDVNVYLPLDNYSGNLHLDHKIEATKNLQRISDWVSGFMEVGSHQHSVFAVELATGAVWVGDKDEVPDAFFQSMEASLKEIEKAAVKPLSERLPDTNKVTEIVDLMKDLKELMEQNGIKPPTDMDLSKVVVESQEDFDAPTNPVAVSKEEEKKKVAEEKVEKQKIEQQKIVDRYGWDALVELTTRNKVKIVIKKP